MPDQIAPSMDSIRNIRLTDNGDGTFSLGTGGGGGATPTAGLDMKFAELPLLAVMPISDAALAFDPADLAAATVARISIVGGSIAYGYVNASGITSINGHPMADGDTVIIEGNANINGLHFTGSGTIVITLEGPEA